LKVGPRVSASQPVWGLVKGTTPAS
jgi:hypothetical protein